MKNFWLKIKSNYKKVILDFVPAFLGVLCALILSNWNSNIKENDFINNAIQSIYNDNVKNLKRAEAELAHLEMQIDTFETYLNADTLDIYYLIQMNRGLRLKSYTTTGWDILKNSQLVNKVDYNILQIQSGLFDQIKMHDEVTEKLADKIYNNLESKNKVEKERFYVLIKDLRERSNNVKYSSSLLDSLLISEYKNQIELVYK